MAAIDEQTLVIFSKLLENEHPTFSVKVGGSSSIMVGSDNPSFSIIFRNKKTLLSLLFRANPYKIAVAFINKDIDVDGDLYSVLRLKDNLRLGNMTFKDRLSLLWRISTI